MELGELSEPPVNLAGRGTGGRSPAFQGTHLNPIFPAMQKAGCGTVPGFYASGGRGPAYPMVPFGVPWGYTLVLSWFTQVWVNVTRLHLEASQSSTLNPLQLIR